MLIRNRGAEPMVGPRARVMYGAVLDSEASKVDVGATAIVCENAVLGATSAGGVDLLPYCAEPFAAKLRPKTVVCWVGQGRFVTARGFLFVFYIEDDVCWAD